MATRQFTETQVAARSGGSVGRVIRLGMTPYRKAWAMQAAIAGRVRQGLTDETLLLLEHPHTYTKGRLAADSDLLLDATALKRRGIELVDTDRGGLITYHGPGQLVAYPIIRLRGRGGPHWYVRALEQVIVGSLNELGLPATVLAGLTGVWTADGERKLAAIGVRIAGGVTTHGFAINLDPDLAMFEGIIPCGIRERGVTSIAAELAGAAPTLENLADVVVEQFAIAMGWSSVAVGEA